MARRLKFDIPGPDWRVDPEEVRARGWEAVFAPDLRPPLRLVLEIGFGRGEFLMEQAARDPTAAHVGVEVSFKRVLKMARRLARTPLRNVRLLHAPGEWVLRELVAPGSLERVWINFPDPWPKKRHHKRRLIKPEFVAALAERLREAGELQIATDHSEYAEQIDHCLRQEPRLENAFAPRPYVHEMPGRTPTAYELEGRAAGRPIYFWCYRRRPEAGRAAAPGGAPVRQSQVSA